MDQIVTLFLISFGIIFLLGFGAFGLISRFERERKAAREEIASGKDSVHTYPFGNEHA